LSTLLTFCYYLWGGKGEKGKEKKKRKKEGGGNRNRFGFCHPTFPFMGKMRKGGEEEGRRKKRKRERGEAKALTKL